jgi:hypothetical protein
MHYWLDFFKSKSCASNSLSDRTAIFNFHVVENSHTDALQDVTQLAAGAHLTASTVIVYQVDALG